MHDNSCVRDDWLAWDAPVRYHASNDPKHRNAPPTGGQSSTI